MKSRTIAILAFAGFSFAMAEYSIPIGEDNALRIGADVRARYEGYTSGVPTPDASKNHRHATEYFRVRTRVHGAMDIGSDMTINLSIANRFHYVTTSPGRPNNNGSSTWEFPDEAYVDAANIVYRNLLDGRLSLTAGRQSIGFGNGMIVAEGTPFDQGRSVYFDGLSMKYDYGDGKATMFVFYDQWKDGSVFINDRNRALRSGNVFTAGIYWTHKAMEELNFDLYYVFNDLDDRHPAVPERAHPADASVSMHTVGARVFGKCFAMMDYGLEAAGQFGRDADGDSLAASMADARLAFHLADESSLKPVLGLELTRFSGDDPGTGRNEGWNPLLSQCPLWGEELMPIMLNGMWSNLNMAGAKFTCNVAKDCDVALYATDYMADERGAAVGGNLQTGGGRHVGLLSGACVTYKFLENFSVQGYLSHFMAGNYFGNGHDSNWFRLELNYKF